MQLLYGARFVADLDAIAAHVRADNPPRAISFVKELRLVCSETIAANPRIGRRRPEFGADRYSFATHGRTIFYTYDPHQNLIRFDRIIGRQKPAL